MKTMGHKIKSGVAGGFRTWRVRVAAGAILLAVFGFWRALPEPLFDDPVSAVLEDRSGRLLGAVIAGDEQWRFPFNPEVPEKFRLAAVHFEDKRFFRHPGVDPLAVLRAVVQNVRERRFVSGASTITMQVIRLSRKGRGRTLSEKLIESILALRLECGRRKEEILALYASHAPFGGNVVGLDAAAWRYFGRRPDRLSWGETAALAVLPNDPALVHPNRNRDVLRAKRDRLLMTLRDAGVLDKTDCRLAMAEPLPGKPLPLPSSAPHLLARACLEYKKMDPGPPGRIRTTLDAHLQERTVRTLQKFHERLVDNGVYNGAALILENETGDVLAYAGNTGHYTDQGHGHAVDIITAPRSTGSILKPFLYAAMLQDGMILPRALVADIPTRYRNFKPENFDETYEGAVPADQALARSLNVPAVRMIRAYGTARFHHILESLGMTTLRRGAAHYGLSLIVGGAEGSLWDLAGMYAGMARTLSHYDRSRGKYFADDFRPSNYRLDRSRSGMDPGRGRSRPPVFRAAALWHTMEALSLVSRPEAQGLWRQFSSSKKIAWKTGTSFGFRDAWAIGCTPRYTVAVWIGNADGEGRPGLIGTAAAAPVMFELFSLLKEDRPWFEKPIREMAPIQICRKSGCRARDVCEESETEWAIRAGLKTRPCPYHRMIHLDPTGTWRAHSDCLSPSEMVHKSWFVLPPVQAWFYKASHASYRPLPGYSPECLAALHGAGERAMQLIYPAAGTRIFVPVELDGRAGRAVFEAAHRHPKKTVHWHMDNAYLGSTRHFHQMDVNPSPGAHSLVLVDEDGGFLEQRFEVIGRIK